MRIKRASSSVPVVAAALLLPSSSLSSSSVEAFAFTGDYGIQNRCQRSNGSGTSGKAFVSFPPPNQSLLLKPSSSSSGMTTSIHSLTRSTILFASGGNGKRMEKDDDDDDKEEGDKEEGEEEEDEEEEDEESLYEQFAKSEFLDTETNQGGKITTSSSQSSPDGKVIDWGGEYDTLRTRFDDVKENKTGPSNTLFRIMTSQTPNEAIMSFINDASPQVVTAMSSTVSNLLGGLTNPSTGMEMIVKANGEKLGSLCFQLQMTGYMFRNAEYVLAIRDLMNINGQASLQDYKNAFDKLDTDKSGFIEANEVYELLSEVYNDDIPSFEVDAFLNFFDSNQDGRISWDEFERGLGVVADTKAKESRRNNRTTATAALPGFVDEDDDEDEEEDDDDDLETSTNAAEPKISGKVKIEMKNGRVIEVEAKEYIKELKKEAEALKAALRREKEPPQPQEGMSSMMPPMAGKAGGNDQNLGIAGYIASLGGDMESLTKGISPEVVDAMKKLIDFVLDGGPSGRGKDRKNDKELEMEVPASALQQLALWQLVLGYKLREAEATGEYRKMLE